MMNTKQYFEEVRNYIEGLSESAFNKLLVEAGIEKCPIEDETFEVTPNKGIYKKSPYLTNGEFLVTPKKVA